MSARLIILSGGQSSRMGLLGEYVPKTLLPIYDTCLLRRQISQAIQAGISNIIISTRPAYKTQIEKAVRDSFGMTDQVLVVESAEHERSGMDGLLTVIRKTGFSESLLVSLGDIYYIDNPFRLIDFGSAQTLLFVAQPFNEMELEKGGVVFVTGQNVLSLAARPIPGNRQGLRWSGLSLIARQHQFVLGEFLLETAPDDPPESFFNHLLEQGENIRFQQIADFINNNSCRELTMSTLYELANRFGTDPVYLQAAESFREAAAR